VRDTTTGAALPAPDLPLGTAYGLDFRPGSHEAAFTLSWARSSSDVYSWDVDQKKLTRWTESEVGGLPESVFVEPELVRFPTFDEVAPGEQRALRRDGHGRCRSVGQGGGAAALVHLR
jgi:dipeptidyl aminopeptidase/acylaminoacyl peptidase